MSDRKDMKLITALSTVLATSAGVVAADEQEENTGFEVSNIQNVHIVKMPEREGSMIQEWVVRAAPKSKGEPEQPKSVSFSQWSASRDNADKGKTVPEWQYDAEKHTEAQEEDGHEQAVKRKLKGVMDKVPFSGGLKSAWDVVDGDVDLYFEGLRVDRGNKGLKYKTDIKRIPFLGDVEGLSFKASYGADDDENGAVFHWKRDL